MFIPLGTDRPRRRPTVVNNVLIALNILVFLASTVLFRVAPDAARSIIDPLALYPGAVTAWGFFSYQFLHGGFLHLLGNMLFLYVFGPNVEDRFGRIGYLAFYLLGGAAAGGAHVLLVPNPVIGASGSIAAVTGAFLVLFPKTHVRTLMFFVFIGVFEIPAVWFIGFAIAKDLFFQGLGTSDGVARLAHLGGYGYGIAVAVTLLATKALEREPYDLFSIGRQAHRRRVFKELTTSRGADPWKGETGKRERRKTDPKHEAMSSGRAEVSRLHASGELDEAAQAYKRLIERHGPVTLSRKAQLDVANHLFQQGDHEGAAGAYRLFLEKHESDSESGRVRLMLGLLYARYLDDPERARTVLRAAIASINDQEQMALAETLLEEVG